MKYKCYLCNPVKLGFRTLPSLNAHLSDSEHRASRYKCPHTACRLPFKTIGGLLQHIETRKCRCMTDANWWNNYFTLTNTRSGTHAAEQDSEEYRLLRYAEITGIGGVWECRNGQSDNSGVGWVVLLSLLFFFVFFFASVITN